MSYLKIISAKTAELFAASTKVGAILSDSNKKEKDALEFYGRNLGLTFQIADDTLDYNAELKLFGKKIGQDFYHKIQIINQLWKLRLTTLLFLCLLTAHLKAFLQAFSFFELYQNNSLNL